MLIRNLLQAEEAIDDDECNYVYSKLLQCNKILTYPGFSYNVIIPLRGILFDSNSFRENNVIFYRLIISCKMAINFFVQNKQLIVCLRKQLN